jgi:hypothetical protein
MAIQIWALTALGRLPKRFDPQVLLDPVEEQFDLPAAFAYAGHGHMLSLLNC